MSKPEEFDLSQFEAADTGVLEMLNTAGEPLLFNGQPVTFELYGPGSDVYVRAQAQYDRTVQAQTFAAMRGKTSKGDEARQALVTKLAACTKAVNNFPVPGGAAAVYGNAKLGYLTNQVTRFIEDWANFPSRSTKA